MDMKTYDKASEIIKQIRSLENKISRLQSKSLAFLEFTFQIPYEKKYIETKLEVSDREVVEAAANAVIDDLMKRKNELEKQLEDL